MLYIILAGMWLLIAAAFFVMEWRDPATPYARIPGIGIPLGWLALALVAYNLIRLAVWRQRKKRRAHAQLNPLLRPRRRDDEPPFGE